MKKLTAKSLRSLFIEFFVQKGHALIPSASLIPENDPTVLFTTAGMHPLVRACATCKNACAPATLTMWATRAI